MFLRTLLTGALVAVVVAPTFAAEAVSFNTVDVQSVLPPGKIGFDSGVPFSGTGSIRISASGEISVPNSGCATQYVPTGCEASSVVGSPGVKTGALIGAFTDASGSLVGNWLPIGTYSQMLVPARAAHLVFQVSGVDQVGVGSYHVVTDKVQTLFGPTGVRAVRSTESFQSRKSSASATIAPGTSTADVAYLLRRFGFSDTPANIAAVVKAGGAGPWVKSQINPQSINDSLAQSEVLPLAKEGAVSFTNQNGYAQVRETELDNASRRQLLQKVTQHWLQHFSLGESKIFADYEYNGQTISHYAETIRKDALGNFAKLVIDVSKEPAMLLWLDNANNIGSDPALPPDENFAREMMQLYTVGPNALHSDGSLYPNGNGQPQPMYTAADIKQVALALSGFTVAFANHSGSPGYPSAAMHMAFNPKNHAPNASYTIMHMTVMDPGNAPGNTSHAQCAWDVVKGSTGPCILDNVINAIVNNQNNGPTRNTAAFESKELIERFGPENPSGGFVERVKQVWLDNAGADNQLALVVQAIATDPEFYATKYQTVKEPNEFVLDAIRALGGANANVLLPAQISNTYVYPWPLGRFGGVGGESIFDPPTVFGLYTPGGAPNGKESMLNTAQSLWRWNTAAAIDEYPFGGCEAYCRAQNLDLSQFKKLTGSSADITTLSTYLVNALVDGGNPGLNALVSNYLGEKFSADTFNGGAGPAQIQRAIWIILSSPEYEVD